MTTKLNHPSVTHYSYGCRCDLCKRVKNEANKEYIARRKELGIIPKKRAEHGSVLMYKRGCRCLKCRLNKAEYVRMSKMKNLKQD